jgi:hypothetical protein
MSASHRRSGRAARKQRSTRSGAETAFLSGRVVDLFLPRMQPRRSFSRISRATLLLPHSTPRAFNSASEYYRNEKPVKQHCSVLMGFRCQQVLIMSISRSKSELCC